jgi:hypothetical protein
MEREDGSRFTLPHEQMLEAYLSFRAARSDDTLDVGGAPDHVITACFDEAPASSCSTPLRSALGCSGLSHRSQFSNASIFHADHPHWSPWSPATVLCLLSSRIRGHPSGLNFFLWGLSFVWFFVLLPPALPTPSLLLSSLSPFLRATSLLSVPDRLRHAVYFTC